MPGLRSHLNQWLNTGCIRRMCRRLRCFRGHSRLRFQDSLVTTAPARQKHGADTKSGVETRTRVGVDSTRSACTQPDSTTRDQLTSSRFRVNMRPTSSDDPVHHQAPFLGASIVA